MNKHEFINKLEEELKLEHSKCVIINSVLEDTFIIGKNNKEIMIRKFMEELNIEEEYANEIYDKVCIIIKNAIKNKLRHPFKGKD